MNIFKRLLGIKEVIPNPESKTSIGGYKIHMENAGFLDIKVGDKFEGCACGHFFTDQVCIGIEGDTIYGTTTLAVFKREYIRPINKNSIPTLETFGTMRKYHNKINDSLLCKTKKIKKKNRKS